MEGLRSPTFALEPSRSLLRLEAGGPRMAAGAEPAPQNLLRVSFP